MFSTNSYRREPTALLFFYLFLYLYVADFIRDLHRKTAEELFISFDATLNYEDDVFSPNNSRFSDYKNGCILLKLKRKKKPNRYTYVRLAFWLPSRN